jgi:hypothetical protein
MKSKHSANAVLFDGINAEKRSRGTAEFKIFLLWVNSTQLYTPWYEQMKYKTKIKR